MPPSREARASFCDAPRVINFSFGHGGCASSVSAHARAPDHKGRCANVSYNNMGSWDRVDSAGSDESDIDVAGDKLTERCDRARHKFEQTLPRARAQLKQRFAEILAELEEGKTRAHAILAEKGDAARKESRDTLAQAQAVSVKKGNDARTDFAIVVLQGEAVTERYEHARCDFEEILGQQEDRVNQRLESAKIEARELKEAQAHARAEYDQSLVEGETGHRKMCDEAMAEAEEMLVQLRSDTGGGGRVGMWAMGGEYGPPRTDPPPSGSNRPNSKAPRVGLATKAARKSAPVFARGPPEKVYNITKKMLPFIKDAFATAYKEQHVHEMPDGQDFDTWAPVVVTTPAVVAQVVRMCVWKFFKDKKAFTEAKVLAKYNAIPQEP